MGGVIIYQHLKEGEVIELVREFDDAIITKQIEKRNGLIFMRSKRRVIA